MKELTFQINGIPALLLGEESGKIYLFIHGKQGYKEEARAFAEITCPLGWQVLAIDLPGHGERRGETGKFDPWHVVPELRTLMAYARARWKRVALRATSLGAWFSMLAFEEEPPERSLFVSPVLDMGRLIETMMGWAGVTAAELEAQREIETGFGEILSWRYYQYARQHPIQTWPASAAILYGGGDALTDRRTVDAFVRRFHWALTVLENGEHWFHTPEQLAALRQWTQVHVAP